MVTRAIRPRCVSRQLHQGLWRQELPCRGCVQESGPDVMITQQNHVCCVVLCHAVLCNVLQPIIYYFALATDADPIPFLTAMFTAANIWSMLLFVGEQHQAAAALNRLQQDPGTQPDEFSLSVFITAVHVALHVHCVDSSCQAYPSVHCSHAEYGIHIRAHSGDPVSFPFPLCQLLLPTHMSCASCPQATPPTSLWPWPTG
jgi:hypothetical protein